jgi:hypothetical protein
VSKRREPFLAPAFRGERFEGGALPIDVLEELVELRGLLLDVAKHLFRSDNPSRKRLPRGFESEFQLVLVGVGVGSAVPSLALEPTDAGGTHFLGPDESVADYFVRARRHLIDEIEAANTNSAMKLPKSLVQRFDRFGRRLLANDSVCFRSDDGRAVEYTQETRRRLTARAGERFQRLEKEFVGPVVAVDEENSSPHFKVWLAPTITARVPLPEAERDDVIDALQNNAFTRCRLRAEALCDERGAVTSVRCNDQAKWTLEDAVGSGDAERVDTRMRELQALEAGWFDGRGMAINPLTLKFVKACVIAVMAARPDVQPYLYPTPEGGVRVEYVVGDCEVSGEFDESRTCYFHAFDRVTQHAEEAEWTGTEWEFAARMAERLPPGGEAHHER